MVAATKNEELTMFETFLILGLLAASHAADAEPAASAGAGSACEYRLAASPAAQGDGWVDVTDPAEIFSMRAFARGAALRKKCEPAVRAAAPVPASEPSPSEINWEAAADSAAVAVAAAMGAEFAAAVIGGPVAAAVGGWLFGGAAAGAAGFYSAGGSPTGGATTGTAAGTGAGLSAATGGSPALGAVLGLGALAIGSEIAR
jgi:hypothetical protein